MKSVAEPTAVLAALADFTRIPDWAPAFADAGASDDRSGWRATKDGRDFTVRVVTKRGASTVDYLREIAPGRDSGAYIRVVPRPPGGGDVIVGCVPVVADLHVLSSRRFRGRPHDELRERCLRLCRDVCATA